MTPAVIVRLAVAAFATVFAVAAIPRHRAFGIGRFELGNMTQTVWSTANGTSSRSRTSAAIRLGAAIVLRGREGQRPDHVSHGVVASRRQPAKASRTRRARLLRRATRAGHGPATAIEAVRDAELLEPVRQRVAVQGPRRMMVFRQPAPR